MKPFIYYFETYKNKYFYDVNSNAIVRVSPELYNYLKHGCFSENYDIKVSNEIAVLVQAGMLGINEWECIEHPETELLKEKLDGSIDTLTLQVTQQCNLRCKYCPYSGSYYNRKHSTANMDIKTAKKAIDFYIKHSYDRRILNIGFYGGEPLIQFDMIKELVRYAHSQGEGKEVEFFMTTNATLLNEESIHFLAVNKFNLAISLDGPREMHDKNRENVNGEGSFDKVIENVHFIQKRYPEYMGKILFNCVIDGKGDIGCLSDFFANYEAVKNIQTVFNNVASEGVKDKEILNSSEEYNKAYEYEIFKLLLNKCNFISEKEISPVVKAYYEHLKSQLKGRSIQENYNKRGHPGGPCVPGVHKLFVNIRGDFYPCEKLNECVEEFVIGNIESGFDYNQAEKLLNIGRTTQEECKKCWCRRFCYQCVLFSEEENSISSDTRRGHCESVRRAVDDMFKDYCLIKEVEAADNNIYFL